MTILKAPFPYFGGKARIADTVWAAMGQPSHYIEPFFGSGAVLLRRPEWKPNMTETVNDKDGFIANVWRSIQFSPDETAKWCDWPVNHADLNARRKELITNERRLLEGLEADAKWHDPVMAGYWIWAASCWIGGGLTRPNAMPHLSNNGMGVHAVGQRPHLSDAGMGVHAKGQLPHIYEWFARLSERLRGVRVVCGDWTRVCGGDWQDKMGHVGMFFDPPYGVEDRDTSIYHHDSTTVAADVMAWCAERGERKSYRIVIAGYEEYEELLGIGWRVESWKANGGYANESRSGVANKNCHRERLYFSPHCVNRSPMLF